MSTRRKRDHHGDAMNTILSPAAEKAGKTACVQRLARKGFFHMLGRLARGALTIHDSSGSHAFGSASPDGYVRAEIHVQSEDFYSSVLFGGDIGAAESYIRGEWDSPGLTDVIRVIALNPEILDAVTGGCSLICLWISRILHLLRKNTPSGSRRNIHEHYDLGNDFFSLFLDPTMTYSCALFTRPDMTLEEASREKYRQICSVLNVHDSHHIMEIGTGWGGFAIFAAREYGCRVTTTTISREQYEYARGLVHRLGLESQITVLFRDYRELEGTFDRVVSIEMIEAIGHRFMDTFFRTCASLLKPDGALAIQVITMLDSRFEAYKNRSDFIKKHIFPGSCLLSVASICRSVARVSNLRLIRLEDIGLHYARTLGMWRENFQKNLPRLAERGYSPSFLKMWLYYLSYCEGGFRERYISDAQMFFCTPLCRI
ncbi:MAG: cyclopropane-fatty-acyl-phospholipid synthase family protein [Candidatus Eremiobacteraeota bacterium]|nr:cyclopropane-fatty-acyl-phospholipid synthase family protein [Candidatus Eremiobacteraeota bacterium]